jgi:hypothetical protein
LFARLGKEIDMRHVGWATLAIACLILAGFEAPNARDNTDETRSVEALRSLGVGVIVDDKAPGKPATKVIVTDDCERAISITKYAPIQNLKLVKSMELSNAGLGDEFMEYLTGLTQLESLTVVQTSITDVGIERLSHLRNLRKLCLYIDSSITDRGIRYLGRLTNLEKLTIRDCPKVSGAGLMGLRRMTNLRDLDLGWCRIADEGVKALGTLPRLEILVLEGNAVSDESLKYIRAMPKLEGVAIRSTEVTIAGIREFRKARPDVTVDANEGSHE